MGLLLATKLFKNFYKSDVSETEMMRFTGLAICFGFNLVIIIMIIVSCFTKAWWVNNDKSIRVGLWEICIKSPEGRDHCETSSKYLSHLTDDYKDDDDYNIEEYRHLKGKL